MRRIAGEDSVEGGVVLSLCDGDDGELRRELENSDFERW